jgi:hypothetical protein
MKSPLKNASSVYARHPLPSEGCTQGAIQHIDAIGREIAVLLSTGLEFFYVPPDCPIFLHGERIKLRLIQPRDQARISFCKREELFVVERLEVQSKAVSAHRQS